MESTVLVFAFSWVLFGLSLAVRTAYDQNMLWKYNNYFFETCHDLLRYTATANTTATQQPPCGIIWHNIFQVRWRCRGGTLSCQ